jgi:cytochrome oxidase Cu insertion factor (SCO1/SenC/PrrC family)
MNLFRWAVGIGVAFAVAVPMLVRAGDIEPERGHSVPSITWIDDAGRTRQLSEFEGFPVVLLPVYTRCKTACIANADQLKKVLAESALDPTQVRVMLFSFDASDTPAALAAYRKRESIPLSWYIGTASQAGIDRLLDSLGFQAAKAGTEFMHTNLLVFLDPKLRIAKWIYGTDYTARDVDSGLRVAAGQSDWIGQHLQWLYALLVFGASVLCVTLGNYLVQLRRAAA